MSDRKRSDTVIRRTTGRAGLAPAPTRTCEYAIAHLQKLQFSTRIREPAASAAFCSDALRSVPASIQSEAVVIAVMAALCQRSPLLGILLSRRCNVACSTFDDPDDPFGATPARAAVFIFDDF